MGKKKVIGKARKDRYYELAKETGYRARSAFKLLQLNRKYEFLQNCRVCIDLCAAPGGWLQVASQYMPMSSMIIGIDLYPIKPIRNVTTFTEDITTEKCKQVIRKQLRAWTADVFLNDGSPNIGKNWLHDAFQQASLTLHALKLACDFLRKGGWFVSKVFRSKDYTALMWVFGQLFHKVFATKPQASRKESAEIFVVCKGFLKPDKIDPKFFDAKFVFRDVATEGIQNPLKTVFQKEKKAKAIGYDEETNVLHTQAVASEFLESDKYMEMLASAHEIVIDKDKIANHKLTTPEIKECLKDIKVLGKRSIKSLINWRKKYNADLEDHGEEEEEKKEEEDVEEDEEEDLKKAVAAVREDEIKDTKKKKVPTATLR